jgi:hypothetical protein
VACSGARTSDRHGWTRFDSNSTSSSGAPCPTRVCPGDAAGTAKAYLISQTRPKLRGTAAAPMDLSDGDASGPACVKTKSDLVVMPPCRRRSAMGRRRILRSYQNSPHPGLYPKKYSQGVADYADNSQDSAPVDKSHAGSSDLSFGPFNGVEPGNQNRDRKLLAVADARSLKGEVELVR